MAAALVSVILEQLALLGQEVRLVVGVKEEVQKLTNNLHDIHAVLEDAERRQVKEPNVKGWLNKLKDVFYNMDNVLDEWNTAIPKMQIEGDGNPPKPKRKVCYCIPSSCFCYRQVDWRHDIAVKIKELNRTLDVVSNQKARYNFKLTTGNEELGRRIIASVIDVSMVHGRDQDKSTIIDMLSESSPGPTLHIISIVGMRGIGKTTLAKLVYNDANIKSQFQERIWVSVTDPFDEIRIAKVILKALREPTPNSNEMEYIFQRIDQSIKGKKFLLVLDDVWIEDHTRLEQLKNSLKSGSSGSRILVTTHKEAVAKNIGTIEPFQLRQLSNEECWSIFSEVAFFKRSNKERENLKDIGQGIVEKCKGLPLAAKVIGSLLCFKNTREEWQSVLDSEVWKLEEVERGLFPPLLLSYYDLSPIMRQCFLYCAIFPKYYKIEKDRLIKLWMAQGYLETTYSEDMERVGEECYINLAMRSFFQDFEKDNDGVILTCKMHSIVHDFAQFLTKKECSVMEVIGLNRLSLNYHHLKVRHSMFIFEGEVSIFGPINYVKNLRSLIIGYKSLPLTGQTAFEVLDQFTCLRTLDFSACNNYGSSLKKLPKDIGKLIHLRYLNLAYNYELKELPEGVCDLCNLQSLSVTHCKSLEKLPRGLGKLIKLRHLEFASSGISFLPKGFEGLTSLQTLRTFYVSDNSEASNIGDLKNLNHLRGSLEILGLGNVSDMDEVKKAQLEKKEHLIALVLDFNNRGSNELTEAIQPPPNLEELSILHFPGTVFPNWIMPRLHSLTIRACSDLKALPDHILQSTSLKELEISDCWWLGLFYKELLWPKIAHIPNIKSGGEYVQKDGVLVPPQRLRR